MFGSGAVSVTAIAAVALVVGFILKKRNVGGDAVIWLFLVAGIGMAGLLGNLLVNIGGAITNAADTGSQNLAGASVPALAAIGLTLWLAIDAAPRQTTSKVGPWIALVLPSVWALSGGMWAELDGSATSAVAQLGQGMSDFFTSVVQGW